MLKGKSTRRLLALAPALFCLSLVAGLAGAAPSTAKESQRQQADDGTGAPPEAFVRILDRDARPFGLSAKVLATRVQQSSLSLGDDDFQEVTFPNGFVFPFQGKIYTSMFVSSNGYVTFGSGSFDATESGDDLVLGPPRICGLWTDLDPTLGGSIEVSFVDSDFAVIRFADVPRFNLPSDRNSFSIILNRNGAIQILFGLMTSPVGLVGYSAGNVTFNNVITADFKKLGGATNPTGINRFRPVTFQAFTTEAPNDLSNSEVVFLNTDRLPLPGLQKLYSPSQLPETKTDVPLFIEDPAGRFSRANIARMNGAGVAVKFFNNQQIRVKIPKRLAKTRQTLLLDLDLSPGVNLFTGQPIVVRGDAPVFLNAVNPSAVQMFDSNLTLELQGAGFQSGAVVQINDVARGVVQTITDVTQTADRSITFKLPGSFLVAQAVLQFTVINPDNSRASSGDDFRTKLFIVD